MTRRQALLATALITGALTETARAQEKLKVLNSSSGTVSMPAWEWDAHRTPLDFNLRAYKSYHIHIGDKGETFTPEQLLEALTHQHTPIAHIDGMRTATALISSNVRILDVCESCGATYWRER